MFWWIGAIELQILETHQVQIRIINILEVHAWEMLPCILYFLVIANYTVHYCILEKTLQFQHSVCTIVADSKRIFQSKQALSNRKLLRLTFLKWDSVFHSLTEEDERNSILLLYGTGHFNYFNVCSLALMCFRAESLLFITSNVN